MDFLEEERGDSSMADAGPCAGACAGACTGAKLEQLQVHGPVNDEDCGGDRLNRDVLDLLPDLVL
jgi:hypothetical protein